MSAEPVAGSTVTIMRVINCAFRPSCKKHLLLLVADGNSLCRSAKQMLWKVYNPTDSYSLCARQALWMRRAVGLSTGGPIVLMGGA